MIYDSIKLRNEAAVADSASKNEEAVNAAPCVEEALYLRETKKDLVSIRQKKQNERRGLVEEGGRGDLLGDGLR